MNQLRQSTHDDIPALQELIARSGVGLSAPYYSVDQANAITQHVFGVDSQLIDDGTYYVIHTDGQLSACGGWSERLTLFGGDKAKTGPDRLLDPAEEPARIRAFFVAPEMARRGLGRQLMNHCIASARSRGFSALELVSTLPGEPLYLASGFTVLERTALKLPGRVEVPVSHMRREI